MTDVMSSKPWSCKHDQCRSWVRLTVRYVIRYVTCVLHKTFFLDFNLHTARVANTPQHEEGKREESSPQEVSEGCQVGYWITVRVFTPPPKSVDHTVGYTQQGEDLEGKTISFFCLCNSTEEAHIVFSPDIVKQLWTTERKNDHTSSWLTWISDADRKETVNSGLGKVWPPLIRWMACKKTSWPGMTRRSRTWADRWFAPAMAKSNIRWSVCVRLTGLLYLHLYLNRKKCDKGWSSFCGPQEPLQVGNTNANL